MSSNIEQNLNKILSSRYGKDVRQAIHDSIQQCYTDATEDSVKIDTTLTKTGEAADAKIVGDSLGTKF